MESKLQQKAGNNSIQFQIGKIEINNEEQIKKLLSENNEILISNLQTISSTIANNRLKEYENILLPKLVKSEVLSCFSDPAIQLFFRQTQKRAICTDRSVDYEMLSEMLINKIKNKDDFTISAAFEKAINEVNNISNESLIMLTILYSITSYIPITFKISTGLNVLNDIYGKFIKNFELPTGYDWLDNLEIVGAIKTESYGKTKKLDDIYSDNFKFYTSKGLKKNSKNYNIAIEKMINNNLPINNLIENELDKNYIKLPILNQNNINDVSLKFFTNEIPSQIELSCKQQETLKEILDLYEPGDLKEKFKEELRKYNNIKKIIDWWNSKMVNISFKITTIGKVLANTNARIMNSSLPK